MTWSEIVIEIAYVIATALFILSLKWLSSPTTARRGVFAGTLLHHGIVDYQWIAIALVLGTVIGIPLGRVHMTAVPQRTVLSRAFGALCVTLVGTAELSWMWTKRVQVIKRGMSAGFAGIENPLYYLDRTLMLFGDAKGFVGNIVRERTGAGGGH
jgi:NAD/NADP transhydrogenase beta subunit